MKGNPMTNDFENMPVGTREAMSALAAKARKVHDFLIGSSDLGIALAELDDAIRRAETLLSQPTVERMK
jgi:hypothetical protein